MSPIDAEKNFEMMKKILRIFNGEDNKIVQNKNAGKVKRSDSKLKHKQANKKYRPENRSKD